MGHDSTCGAEWGGAPLLGVGAGRFPHLNPLARAHARCSNGSARTPSRVDDLLSTDLGEDGIARGQWVREEQRGAVPPARSLHTLSRVGDELWLIGGARDLAIAPASAR